MKNNLKALGLHLALVILSIIFTIIFVVASPILGKYVTHIISRIFIVTISMCLYILAGLLLDTGSNSKYDFLTGLLIAIIGLVIWYYTFSTAGWNLSEIPKELSGHWIPMNLYHSPFIFINLLIPVPNTPLTSLITNLIPSILLGIGLRYKRLNK